MGTQSSTKVYGTVCWFTVSLLGAFAVQGDELPRLTTLSDTSIRYQVPEKPYVVLKQRDVEVVVVDNRAVDDDVLPGHRAGYSGIASLKHAHRRDNLFVPSYAGLNFEHIHHGTNHHRWSCESSMNTRPSCIRSPRLHGGWRVAIGIDC